MAATPETIRPASLGDGSALAPLLEELGYAAGSEQVRGQLGRLLARADGGVLVAEIAGNRRCREL